MIVSANKDCDQFKILRALATQESIEGPTENIRLLRALYRHLTRSSEWQALVDVRHHKYGILSFQCHIFYYLKPNIVALLQDPDTKPRT